MAKRKRRSGQLKSGRDIIISIAKQSLPLTHPKNIPNKYYRRVAAMASPLLIEDRRRHRPDKSIRPPGAIRKAAAKIKPSRLAKFKFANPDQVAMCMRRKIRKEIMHASGMAGATRIYKKVRQNRNFWSSIGC